MNKYVPLSCHTHYSLLTGFSKPKELAEMCAKYELPACAITDYNSLSGVVSFYKACKSKNIKPILGCKLDIIGIGQVKVLSMNFNGWQELLKVFHSRSLEDLLSSKNLIVTFGDNGSFVDTNDKSNTIIDIFKSSLKDRLFCEIQSIGHTDHAKLKMLTDLSRDIKIIATPNIHYIDEMSKKDHQLLLCSHMKTTFRDCRESKSFSKYEHFFKESSNFKFPSYDEMLYDQIDKRWLENTIELSDMVEEYSILASPKLPTYEWTNGLSEDEYLKELCRKGWIERFANKKIDKNIYGDRAKREFDVIFNAGLSGYFLIVQDYVNWAKNNGWLVGPGRGSAAGCLTSYMLRITNIDPIKYDLLFERFYNDGRNTKDKVSMPDIDVDFPPEKRELIFNYIRNKYSPERVSQVATFGSLKGSGAIKETLRVHNACDNATMNKITKDLPQEAKIQTELEEQQETSIIRYTLKNTNILDDYCQIDDSGNLTGDYAIYFEQAIRLEGTYKSYGKHASALIIGHKPIKEICPVIPDKSGSEQLAGIEYEFLEEMGMVKFDLLGLASLSKMDGVNKLFSKPFIDNNIEDEEDNDEI